MKPSRLPSEGPVVIVIPGLSDAQILPGTSTPELEYRWPRRYKLAGVLLMPVAVTAGTLETAAAALRLQATDDLGEALATDTQGLDLNSFSVPGLALSGIGNPIQQVTGLGGYMPRWHALGREVHAGDAWRMSIRNADPATTITSFLAFRVEVMP